MLHHQRKASEIELDEISKLIAAGRTRVDAIRIVYEKKAKEGVYSTDNISKENLRPKVSRSSSIVVKASVEEIESKKLKKISKHKGKNGNLELPSTAFDSEASHSERDDISVVSTAMSTQNEYKPAAVLDPQVNNLNFSSTRGLAISVPESSSVGSDIVFTLTPSPRRSASKHTSSHASARVNYSQYDQDDDDDELVFSDNILPQLSKKPSRTLGKESIRASQRVDYSGYGDEEEDEANVVYEDNVIPHKKLPLRKHHVLTLDDVQASQSPTDKKPVRMLGKESVRASQRVDYSGYGDDEDNVVYEDNVIPHKKLPLRKHHVLTLDDIQVSDPIQTVSPADKKPPRMLGKESLRASQRVDYSGYGDEEEDEDNVISHKKLPLRKHHVLSLDDIQAIRMVSPTNKSVRMLGKDSARASQRVDYSGYVDEDDEEKIVYEDNTIPHKKPLLPKNHALAKEDTQATDPVSETSPADNVKPSRMHGKDSLRASQRVGYVDENQDTENMATYEENLIPHNKLQSRKSIRFLGMDNSRASARVDYSGYMEGDDDNVTYEDNMIPQSKKPFQMLSKKNLRASQRVDYSGYVFEDGDNITYEDNLIPHDQPQRQAQKTSKIPGVVGNGSASSRVGYSSYEDDDEDNATYEENAISRTNHKSTGGRKLQKRSAERIDPSTLQQSDEETEELAVKSRSYNFRSSTDTRASKRVERQQSRDELAFAQPTGSEQIPGASMKVDKGSAVNSNGESTEEATIVHGSADTGDNSVQTATIPKSKTLTLSEIMDTKPEVTAEDYLEIQYLMSLGILKVPAIETYLEKLRTDGSILRGDKPGAEIVPALISQGFKQVNAVDYFLNKFGEVLKHVIPESIDIHLAEPKGEQQSAEAGPNSHPTGTSLALAASSLSKEDEEIISILMEERKIDKDAATELYLHIIHSEEVSGLKLHSSVVGDTGGEFIETAFLADNALDINATKQADKHSRFKTPVPNKNQYDSSDEEVKALKRILADQDSRFGINMLEVELNGEEEAEIRRLKSIGLTAIESLTTVFETRMSKLPSQRKSTGQGKLTRANSKAVTIDLSRQSSYMDSSKLSAVVGSVDENELDFFHNKSESFKVSKGLERYLVSQEDGNMHRPTKVTQSRAAAHENSQSFYSTNRPAKTVSADTATQRFQTIDADTANSWGLQQPLRISRNPSAVDNRKHANHSKRSTGESHPQSTQSLPPPPPPLPKFVPSMPNLIPPGDNYANAARTEPAISTVGYQLPSNFHTEPFGGGGVGGYVYNPKAALGRYPSVYEPGARWPDFAHNTLDSRFDRILPRYADDASMSVSSGLVKSRVMDINKRLQNSSSSAASLHSYVPYNHIHAHRGGASSRVGRDHYRLIRNVKSKLSPDEEALQIGKLLSFQQMHFGTNMYDSMVPEDYPCIDQLILSGHSQVDAILIVFQEKCAREYFVRTAERSKRRERSTICGGVDYHRRIHGARMRMSADDEALEIGKLLSYQEIQFGTNMYDSLVKADNPRIEQLVRIGHSEGEAILIIFQEKCAPRQPMLDTTHTRQSFPPREQQRPQTQPVRAQQVGSAVSEVDNELAAAIRLSQLGDDRVPGVIRIPGTGNTGPDSNSRSTQSNSSGVHSENTGLQRSSHQRSFFNRIFNRSSSSTSTTTTADPISQLVDLGFTRDQASRALRESNNNIDRAAGLLLGNG